jgi:uncharacterized protein YjbI with pentapeptide repeats
MEENFLENQSFTEDNFKLFIPDAEFESCQFNSINFSEIKFNNIKFIDCTFNKCNLSNVSLKKCSLRDVKFVGCKLIGINWCECSTLIHPEFIESQLDYSVFQGLILSKIKFDRSSLRDVDFSHANLSKTSLTGTLLKNSQFLHANLTGADLRGARDYFIDIKVTNVKKTKFSMPEVLALLDALDVVIE